ncbi:uncharacterized protein LOC127262351 [Andrographis paniculata]|uniref:uncharacterized protein LOC127262351 n=1 Tax=Andrographis paniculata TaxID=175694 RepID=UPI0021E8C2D3|nr:uncharacterized protein LOC127262351 [Andrographis paniculata]
MANSYQLQQLNPTATNTTMLQHISIVWPIYILTGSNRRNHSAVEEMNQPALLFFAFLALAAHAAGRRHDDSFTKLLKSPRLRRSGHSSAEDVLTDVSLVYKYPQDGLKEADKILGLPGQPSVDFRQYSGYVTVDPTAGRALFYYFAEAKDSVDKPLVLWLNGGPGCSSFGNGAMTELGPFRVNPDTKTLWHNEYAWNNVANVIFLESPAGVGFSYSNRSSDYVTGDKQTAADSYTFLINWLERFPEYKTRDFFLAGESYAGHYVPQLAHLILQNNKLPNESVVNLKGITIGNAYIDYTDRWTGTYEHFWTSALISDETHHGIFANCDFSSSSVNRSDSCDKLLDKADVEMGDIFIYDVYAPWCGDNATGSLISNYDPCSDEYVSFYLNSREVQKALHANLTGIPGDWESCNYEILSDWTDQPDTVLPVIKDLMASGLRVWIYSGDTDGIIPVTTTRYSVTKLGGLVKTPWYPWYSEGEVGGYAVEYQNVTFVTVRGSGHFVPSYQPARALTFFSSFLLGKLPPGQPAAGIFLPFLLLAALLSSSWAHSYRQDPLDDLITGRRATAPENQGTRDKEDFPAAAAGGEKEADRIWKLPGQPAVSFCQYSGYVTVDPEAGRALFYWFTESQNASRDPLVLWLTGGPGCSSVGIGALMELGPFRVNPDGKTLWQNEHAWNTVANMLFLESPAGVGFSYSNTSSDYTTGDGRTAADTFVFLRNWLERFPEYKARDFYIAGESYAGHYVPQLAQLILENNRLANYAVVNLKGIVIGNAYVDYHDLFSGMYDYFWSHAIISDESHGAILKNCNFSTKASMSKQCEKSMTEAGIEIGEMFVYDIYAPVCGTNSTAPAISTFDPCSDNYINAYLNTPEVQKAFHANVTRTVPGPWNMCSYFIVAWTDKPETVLPVIKELMAGGISVWIYSGDTDGRVPVTSAKYSVKKLGAAVKTPWRPWYYDGEVGGYAVGYENVSFVTVRGAGHFVPSYQPGRALALFSAFLSGKLP